MTVIYDWVKNLVFFFIWVTAIMYMLPKNNYQKYVKFFTRLLLVILLFTPVWKLFHKSDVLLDKVMYESFWQDMDSVQLDMKGMEEIQKQAYLEEYQEVIGKDVAWMVQEESLQVENVEVVLTETYQVQHIAMVVRMGTQEGILIEKMMLQDNSREYPEILDLKEKIMNFYNITEEQIEIMVLEG